MNRMDRPVVGLATLARGIFWWSSAGDPTHLITGPRSVACNPKEKYVIGSRNRSLVDCGECLAPRKKVTS